MCSQIKIVSIIFYVIIYYSLIFFKHPTGCSLLRSTLYMLISYIIILIQHNCHNKSWTTRPINNYCQLPTNFLEINCVYLSEGSSILNISVLSMQHINNINHNKILGEYNKISNVFSFS